MRPIGEYAGEDFRSPLRRVPPLHTRADDVVEADDEIAELSRADLLARVDRLRRKRDAVILAHNYQVPPVQDVADFVGDSLELARWAATTSARVIVFCGVHFMAETAALLCPDQRVLIPDPEAGCSLAESVTAEDVRRWKAANPHGLVVAYVNTTAAVKAEADVCCTSSNAVAVVASLPPNVPVLFLPDRFLGRYVEATTGRPLDLWAGECHVHAAIRADNVRICAQQHPDAHVLLHPESACMGSWPQSPISQDARVDGITVASTGGMVRHVRTCHSPVDLVGTEVGMLHRLHKENPSTAYLPIRRDAICSYMKTITLEKLYLALRDDVYAVTVPSEVAGRARVAVDRMLAVG